MVRRRQLERKVYGGSAFCRPGSPEISEISPEAGGYAPGVSDGYTQGYAGDWRRFPEISPKTFHHGDTEFTETGFAKSDCNSFEHEGHEGHEGTLRRLRGGSRTDTHVGSMGSPIVRIWAWHAHGMGIPCAFMGMDAHSRFSRLCAWAGSHGTAPEADSLTV